MAEALIRAGNFAGAVRHLTDALQSGPAAPDLLVQRAACWLELRRHERALVDARKVLELDAPAVLRAQANRVAGLALFRQHRFTEAARALREAAMQADARDRLELVEFAAAATEAAERQGPGPQYLLDADPSQAWQVMSHTQRVEPVPVTDPASPVPAGHLRFVCISDTHGMHREVSVPPGDVLIHAGDLTNTGELEQVADFVEWLAAQPHRHKVVIAGNHDTTLDPDYYRTYWPRYHRQRGAYDPAAVRRAIAECPAKLTYLEDASTVIQGLTIYGSPWQPRFCDWAFNVDRGTASRDKWDLIPDTVDVLITHGPPMGHGDRCADGFRAGCADLLRVVQQRVRPKFHVFGHIHEGYGVTTDGTTVYVNASTCTFNYRPSNPAIVFDVPRPAT